MVCFVLPLCAFLFYCPFTILTTRETTNALPPFKRFAGDGNTTPRAADKRVIKHQCSADQVQLQLWKELWYMGARQTEEYGNRLSYRLTTQQWHTHEFCSGGLTNSVEDRGQRERGSGGGSPLVRGSGGSCNLVQKISFHIVKFS